MVLLSSFLTSYRNNFEHFKKRLVIYVLSHKIITATIVVNEVHVVSCIISTHSFCEYAIHQYVLFLTKSFLSLLLRENSIRNSFFINK